MNLKHINLGFVEPKFVLSIWEYPQLFTPESPTIFSYILTDTAVNVCGTERMDKRIKIENLPEDIKFMRFRHETNSMYIYNPDMICFTMHYPDTEEFKTINNAIKAIVFKILKEYGIPLTHKNNDMYLLKDGMEKKFFGIMEKSLIDGWKTMLFCITLRFDSDLANNIIRFDTEKFTKKDGFTNINQIVGGICEANPYIDRNKIAAEVIQKIAERYDLSIEEKELSKNELSKMNELVNKFDRKEWYLNGI